jgi:hypothetical protein
MEEEMMALGNPETLLAQAAEQPGEPAADPPAPSQVRAGNVTVTQEVVSLSEEESTDDWEDVVNDRYGATGGLS